MTLEALAHQLVMYLITLLGYNIINENYVKRTIYWPAPPDDPQGIRVASVFEFSVCLFVCLFVCSLQIF